MELNQMLTLALVVGLLAPAAGASVAPQADRPTTVPQQTTTEVATESGASAAGGTSGTASSTATNYTRLYVEDGYHHLELKPGETDTVEVTVESGEDGPITLSPHLVLPQVRERPVEKDWVSIDAGEVTLDPGAEQTITVTVEIPEGAELGRYQGWVAFTDETLTHPGRPPRPVHAAGLSVEVWNELTVQVLGDRYIHSQVEAGDRFTYEMSVENTGEEAVPLSPEINTQQRHRPRDNTVDRSWFEIDAPAEVPAGETAAVRVTIVPPDDAERGRYGAELDLGLTDPARPEGSAHWQRVDLNFQVWKQPADPYETEFAVAENVTDMTVTLSPQSASYPQSGSGQERQPTDFDVTFVSPSGEEIEATRVSVTDRGFVDLGEARRSVATDEEYVVRGNGQEFVYRLEDPTEGSWTLRAMPENTVGFSYEIVREESE